ncbi:MAG: hypothetical protein AMXMBFR82_52740 [Candidatus Hydrogenedentota bacterium]
MPFLRIKFFPQAANCLILAALSLSTAGYADMVTSGPITADLRVSVSDDSVPAGFPLKLNIQVTSSPEATSAPLRMFEFESSNSSLAIINDQGQTVSRSLPPLSVNDGFLSDILYWGVRLDKAGSSAVLTMPFEAWCSTDLAPGTYRLKFTISEFLFKTWTNGSGSTKSYSNEAPYTWEAKLIIEEEDVGRVEAAYAHLLAAARQDITSRDTETARKMIVLAKSRVATSYQLQLLRCPELQQMDVSHLCRALVRQGGADVATGIVETLQSDQVTQKWKRHLISWALYQIHQKRNPNVLEITEPYFEAHKPPRNPSYYMADF